MKDSTHKWSFVGYITSDPKVPITGSNVGWITLPVRPTVPEALAYAGYVIRAWDTLRMMLFVPTLKIAEVYRRVDPETREIQFKVTRYRLLTPEEQQKILEAVQEEQKALGIT